KIEVQTQRSLLLKAKRRALEREAKQAKERLDSATGSTTDVQFALERVRMSLKEQEEVMHRLKTNKAAAEATVGRLEAEKRERKDQGTMAAMILSQTCKKAQSAEEVLKSCGRGPSGNKRGDSASDSNGAIIKGDTMAFLQRVEEERRIQRSLHSKLSLSAESEQQAMAAK
ncbi:unnamed protein product, partial [Discosporangium mesarthrocarpum]